MSMQPDAPRSIHFDIGRVTLHGYSSGDRDRFANALQLRLTELAVGQQGAWPSGGNRFIERLDGGTIPAGASPERAARVVAARVFGAVTSAAGASRPGQVADPGGFAGLGGAGHA